MSQWCEEVADVYCERPRKARKAHTCAACVETIPAGARYMTVRIIFDGTVRPLKRCMRCQKIHEHLRDLNTLGHEEWPDERLNCGHEYAEVHGREPPDEIAALAFALPGTHHD